jgi:hypothetical protein
MAFVERLQVVQSFFKSCVDDPVKGAFIAAVVLLVLVALWAILPGLYRAIFGKKVVVVKKPVTVPPIPVVIKLPQKVYVEVVETTAGAMKFNVPDHTLTDREKWLIKVAAQASQRRTLRKLKKRQPKKDS